MARILVVEDEKPINELVCRNLQLVGHMVEPIFNGTEALNKLENTNYDLILLDVMMPGLSGFELAKQLRYDIPIIFVTAKEDLSSRLEGLGLGGDDYITKPFEILELLARVEAVLRRTNNQQSTFEYAGVSVNLDTHQVYVRNEEVTLALKEFELLETLIRNRNLALSRERLLELVWGFDYAGESRTVDMHILRLRQKLHWEDVIQTVYKVGYRLNTRP